MIILSCKYLNISHTVYTYIKLYNFNEYEPKNVDKLNYHQKNKIEREGKNDNGLVWLIKKLLSE